jgi:hypothetical protein
MTFPAQQFRQMASDETRSTGDEDIAHVRAPPTQNALGRKNSADIRRLFYSDCPAPSQVFPGFELKVSRSTRILRTPKRADASIIQKSQNYNQIERLSLTTAE